jgi:hypothetical protein
MNLIPTEKRIAIRTVNTRYERSASMDTALKGSVSQIVGLGTVLMMPRRLIEKREIPNQQAHQSSDFIRAIKLVFTGINHHLHTEYFSVCKNAPQVICMQMRQKKGEFAGKING